MNISRLKRCFLLLSLSYFFFIPFFPSIAQAADIQAQLDNTSGSGLSVQNSSSNEVARIDNAGNLTTHGNAGIGTTSPMYRLDVNGDLGSSTTGELLLQDQGGMVRTANNILDDENGNGFFAGNVGIGSAAPGTALDVTGTVRMTGLTMSGQSPSSGYVLTAVNSSGETTWSPASGVSGWTITNTNDVYETGLGNVGIGTTRTTTAALTVMNGNVGIGTWVPAAPLTVGANAFTVNSLGAITATAAINQNGGAANTLSGNTAFTANLTSATFAGNVGIGTLIPGAQMDVTGTIRTTNFIMSGQTPSSGYVLTAVDSAGETTWSPAGGIAGWTVLGTNVFTTTGSNNVGIGTSTPEGGLVVTNGNVGIGTWAPTAALAVGANVFTVNNLGAMTQSGGAANSLSGNTAFTASGTSATFTGNVGIGTTTPGGALSVPNGNVGIGTLIPGMALDVTGTIRTTNFTMSGQAPSSGYVLTAVNSSGETTWSPAGGVSGWTITNTNDVYETGLGNVGIGTIKTSTAALTVMNGNVGIGTWVPAAPLTVGANAFTVNSLGAITATTAINQNGGAANLLSGNTAFTASGTSATFTGNVGIGTTTPGGALSVPNGNVGIGTLIPGAALDVTGTVRTTNFTMSGQAPSSGYVLTAVDSTGETTWSPAGGIAGWTVSGTNVYTTTGSNNVGIGTSTPEGGLVVTNGNVGIGTWAPTAAFAVGANTFTVNNLGAITQSGGAANSLSGNTAFTANGISATFTGNVGLGTTTPQTALAINNGNVGIGTWTAAGGSLIVATGNVGIGSLAPGEKLDVNGTVRAAYFIGNASQMSGLPSSQWVTGNSVNDIYLPNSGNVGIGTSFTTGGAALSVMNGNVGIGTWAPFGGLEIKSSVATALTLDTYNSAGTAMSFTSSGTPTISLINGTTKTSISSQDSYFSNGNLGIGTTITTAGAALTVMNGNVGIGTWAPGNLLDVHGNVGIGSSIVDSSGSARLTLTSGEVDINLQ